MAHPTAAQGIQDVQVGYEDQQKINLFARKNARMIDMKAQIAAKEKELQNLEDASDDLMLQDEDDPVPYQIGEVFIHMSSEDSQASVERSKAALKEEVARLVAGVGEIKGVLSDLKVALYAKFGDNINLEGDESG